MSIALHLLLGLIAGVLIAVAHFRTLAPGVNWLSEGRTGSAVALLLGRMTVLVATLVALALFSRWVLVGAVSSLVVVRMLLVRHAVRSR